MIWLSDWRALVHLIAANLLFAAGLYSPEVFLDVCGVGELLRFLVLLIVKVELVSRIDLPQLLVDDLPITLLPLSVLLL